MQREYYKREAQFVRPRVLSHRFRQTSARARSELNLPRKRAREEVARVYMYIAI